MRRRAGVGAIHKQKLEAEKYKDKGIELQDSQFEQMAIRTWKCSVKILRNLQRSTKTESRKTLSFVASSRKCAIGVDPLASGKGFWSVLGMGDFYYELGVQVVEVCLAANHSVREA